MHEIWVCFGPGGHFRVNEFKYIHFFLNKIFQFFEYCLKFKLCGTNRDCSPRDLYITYNNFVHIINNGHQNVITHIEFSKRHISLKQKHKYYLFNYFFKSKILICQNKVSKLIKIIQFIAAKPIKKI